MPYAEGNTTGPHNPLGKIKIAIGGGILICEAAKREDIGAAVSHGYLRMQRADLFDLTGKIIAARNLPVTKRQIDRVKESNARLVVPLDSPLLVDINYDLEVVEGGVLRLYPDVYERGAFALDRLRAELQGAGMNASRLDDEALQQMLKGVHRGEQFAIRVADLKRGRWNAGGTSPLMERRVRGNRGARGRQSAPAAR